MRNLCWATVLLTLLLGATVLCAVFMQPDAYVAAQDAANPTDEPIPTSTETPFSAENATEPQPTECPTPVIDPGSPLTVGGDSLEETLSQLDIISLAEMVIAALGVMWVIIILVTYVKRRDKGEEK
jgi:hypothetical protein